MNHSETEGDGTDREMCIGQSRDGVGTKGERERKRRKTLLWRWEERETERAANARNPITKCDENDDR